MACDDVVRVWERAEPSQWKRDVLVAIDARTFPTDRRDQSAEVVPVVLPSSRLRLLQQDFVAFCPLEEQAAFVSAVTHIACLTPR